MSQPNTTWIIHNKAIEKEAYSNLAEIVTGLGYSVHTFDNWELLLNPGSLHLPNINDCVIPYCTYVAARQLRQYSGMYFNEVNQLYHVYTSLMGIPLDLYLNDDAVLTTFAHFRDHPDHWYTLFTAGTRGNLFVRPNSGSKTFTGHLIPRDDFKHYINAMSKGITDDSLIWVANEKIFWDECRFIICDDIVVDGSRYATDSGRVLIQDRDVPAEHWELAKRVAACEWKPDAVFTLDICSTRQGDRVVSKIVELNGFNTASWYACDTEKIVKEVTEHSIELWKDAYG